METQICFIKNKPTDVSSFTNDAGYITSASVPSGVPSGTIVMYNSSSAPTGWVICDGSNSTPDLRGRFIVGYSDTDSDYDVDDTGGEKTKQLGTANLPSHTHQLGGNTGSQNLTHNHSYVGHTYPGSGPEQNQSGGPEDRTSFNVAKTTGNNSGNLDHSHTLPANTGNQGGTMGQAFDNKPPYIALAYIIRTV